MSNTIPTPTLIATILYQIIWIIIGTDVFNRDFGIQYLVVLINTAQVFNSTR